MTIPLDEQIFLWINGFVGKVPPFDWLMILLGDDYFVFATMAVILLGLWFWFRNLTQKELNQRAVLYTVLGVVLTCIVIHFLTDYGPYRPRPSVAYPGLVNLLTYERSDPSFPSEPAAIAFAFTTGVWLFKRGRLGVFMLIMALLHTFARVYIGIHYPLDTFVGGLIGITSSYVTYRGLRAIEPWPTRLISLAKRIYLA